MKLSIIIPVYNVEQWVSRCLESCLCQDIPYDDYEIIVVNDGTPDRSIERVQEVQAVQIAQDGTTNIRIINRENGGLSAARNTGLKEAKGEYVWFIDSDDWIEPNVLGNLFEKINQNSLDVLCFNLQFAYPDGHNKKHSISSEESGKVYQGVDFICKVGMPRAAWIAIYRRRYLLENNLHFYKGILHEDQEFTPRAYSLAGRIAYVDCVAYNYFQREGGIMKSKNHNVKRCRDLLTVADSLFSFANEKFTKGSNIYNVFRTKVAFAFTQSLAYYTPDAMPISCYKEKEYYPLYIAANLDIKTKLKYHLVNFSIRLYLQIYKLK